MADDGKKKDTDELSEEERKELRRRRKALKRKRLEKKKQQETRRIRALLAEDEELVSVAETPEERQARLYAKAQKKMGFAPHMYQRLDQSDMYRQASELFAKTPGYGQSDELREECSRLARERMDQYAAETASLVRERLPQAKTIHDCEKLRGRLSSMAGYPEAEGLDRECIEAERRIEKKLRQKKIINFLCLTVVLAAVIIVIVNIKNVI